MSRPNPVSAAEIAAAAAHLGQQLQIAHLVCATAESCTGGLIGHLITETPGSSAYFVGGAIVYSNEAKEQVLGVQHASLLAHGAVSFEVAQEMARGARRLYQADLAVAVTGVAGPDGGTPAKPVGTVHIHLSAADGTEEGARFVWTDNRSLNKLLSAQAAIALMQAYLDSRSKAA